jgi:hypothetical protein
MIFGSPAYYNEIDPYAARWLRALIAGQVLPANIPFGREERGKSGREPKPFPATCNSETSASGQDVPIRAYEPHRARVFRRRIDTREVPPDWFCKTAQDCHLAASLSSFWRGRSPLAVGGADKIRVSTLSRSLGDTCRNTTICCVGRGREGTTRRMSGKRVRSRAFRVGACATNALCSGLNNISDECGSPAFQCRTRCTLAARSSGLYATSCREAQ